MHSEPDQTGNILEVAHSRNNNEVAGRLLCRGSEVLNT